MYRSQLGYENDSILVCESGGGRDARDERVTFPLGPRTSRGRFTGISIVIGKNDIFSLMSSLYVRVN
jgi:hypothetical protein